MAPSPSRHDLVWLDPARAGGLEVAPGWRDEVERWLARGLPAVARRRDGEREAAAGAAAVALGIPVPPSRGKARIPLSAPPAAVLRVEPPLPLAAALASAPAAWRQPLRSLDGAARALGVLLRVHGSLAWQHLAGEPWVVGGSDVDLLVDLGRVDQVEPALGLLAAWERKAGIRADGEVRLPAGGVAWRELASGARQVLLKSDAAARLVPRAAALAGLAALPGGGAP